LNACKPSILETKPPIKLNVSQEDNPPFALIASIRENLGNQLGEAALEKATPYRPANVQGIQIYI
jgi:hypothetical protein